MRIIGIMLSHQKLIYQSVSMSTNDSKGHHVCGNICSPDKENELSTLRDISLLPTLYKILPDCLVNRLLLIIVETAVHFWQRACSKERDCQELIFCLKTAINDFKHRSSKFYTSFVDF